MPLLQSVDLHTRVLLGVIQGYQSVTKDEVNQYCHKSEHLLIVLAVVRIMHYECLTGDF
jgi:hypothetical protein